MLETKTRLWLASRGRGIIEPWGARLLSGMCRGQRPAAPPPPGRGLSTRTPRRASLARSRRAASRSLAVAPQNHPRGCCSMPHNAIWCSTPARAPLGPRPGECSPWADRGCSARSFVAMLVFLSIADAHEYADARGRATGARGRRPLAPGARPWTLQLRGGDGDADAGALRAPGVIRLCCAMRIR